VFTNSFEPPKGAIDLSSQLEQVFLVTKLYIKQRVVFGLFDNFVVASTMLTGLEVDGHLSRIICEGIQFPVSASGNNYCVMVSGRSVKCIFLKKLTFL